MSEKVNKKSLCPVCGYNFYLAFGEYPWDGESSSLEFCPSCGIQFGYYDVAGGDKELRKRVYREWRDRWIAEEMKWNSKGMPKPENWDPKEQLKVLEELEKNREEK